MTLPWARLLWKEHERMTAKAQLDALEAASLGSAAKYGGEAGRAYRRRATELTKAAEGSA